MRRRVRGAPVLAAVLTLAAALGPLLTPSALGTGAALVPPHADQGHDVDSDGIFDFLLVEVRVLVDEPGIFRLEGQGSWHPLGFTHSLSILQAGFQTVPLFFNGFLIWASGIDGPYEVELSLYDVNLDLLGVGTHTTAAYGHLDFEGRPAAFAPPHRDYGLDTDGDGLFNFLVVEASVFVADAGTYTVKAHIDWPSGPSAENRTTLEVGFQTVPLRFDGGIFVTARWDGPYSVRLDLWDPLNEVRERDHHVTASYSYLDFEEVEPSAAFAPPHSDGGLDTDGDGAFDYLVVAVSLQVEEAGTYTLRGRLELGAQIIEASNTTELPPTSVTVLLRFGGQRIRASGNDGPYEVELMLGGRNDTHLTAAYSHLDFESAAAIFAPPHSDHGLDTDGNGLYDFLVVEASVNVTEAGTYGVSGWLGDFDGDFVSNTTAFGIGIQTVLLRFDGAQINFSREDGPYEVNLLLSASGFYDSDTHLTANYSHLEFERPPAVLSPPYSDEGRDLDGDGLYDFLVVNVSVEVRKAGTYWVLGSILGRRPYVDLVQNVTTLGVGLQTVPLWFYGHRISLSQIDGPYTVDVLLHACEGGGGCTFFGNDAWHTASYLALDFEEPESEQLQSAVATIRPDIDGAFSPGEWSDASRVDLALVLGNQIPGFLLVKSDDEFLYVGYDATGDVTEDFWDTAGIAFDTDNDQVRSEGREDEFVQGGFVPEGQQAHSVFHGTGWIREDSPYDAGLPNHTGLASARGFGPSDGSQTNHRTYEFAIPLTLLAVTPGDTIGFFGGSHWRSTVGPGLFDRSGGRFSSWPVGRDAILSLAEYGDLILADTKPTVSISDPIDGLVSASNVIHLSWSADDVGSGLDHFIVRLDGGAPVRLEETATGYLLAGLADGSHRVEVTAVDMAGHERADTVNFTVDTTPPTLSISSIGQGEVLTSSTVHVTWTSADEISGVDHFQISLDGEQAVQVVEPRHLFRGVSDGLHTVTVVAFDRMGHSRVATVEFTVDTNLFSPTGPYGVAPLIGTLAAAVAVGLVLLFFARRRPKA